MLTIFLYVLLGIYVAGLVFNAYLYHTMFTLAWRDDPKYLPKMVLALIFWPVYYVSRMW